MSESPRGSPASASCGRYSVRIAANPSHPGVSGAAGGASIMTAGAVSCSAPGPSSAPAPTPAAVPPSPPRLGSSWNPAAFTPSALPWAIARRRPDTPASLLKVFLRVNVGVLILAERQADPESQHSPVHLRHQRDAPRQRRGQLGVSWTRVRWNASLPGPMNPRATGDDRA
jgi:hypothetical protein